jgi:hypothetical protein
MLSLFRFPPDDSALHVEGSIRTYFWKEKTDCLTATCGIDTYSAISVTEVIDGYYMVEGTGTALNVCGDSTNGHAKYGGRSLRDLLHFYRDLRHQATLPTLLKQNPKQSDKMKRVCSILGNLPLMNVLVFQDEVDSRAKLCRFEKTAASMWFKWLGLPEDASVDDLFQASLADWADQPSPQWSKMEYHGLLDLPLLPFFIFGDTPNTVEFSEHSNFPNSGLLDEITRYEEDFMRDYLQGS